MEDEVEDDNTKYWWSEKPTPTAVIVALLLFPIVLGYWGFVTIAKKITLRRAKKRWIKHMGRPMRFDEELVYKVELDRKYKI